MTTIQAPQPISIVLAAPAPDVLTSCNLVPPTPPPAPPDSGIIYTPVAPGITYAALPTVTIVDTSPDQIIGCIHDTADNPQGRLNVLFPSAINGDGVIERRNNDIWVYNGTLWNNVGPSPGPTVQTVPILILPYNETAVYEGRVRLGNVVTKFEYALELLTVVPALNLKASVEVRRILKVETPAANFGLAALTPAVSSGAALRPPVAGTTIAAPLPAIASGAAILVSASDLVVTGVPPESTGRIKTQVLVPSVSLTAYPQAPSVSGGSSIEVPVKDIAVAALSPASIISVDPNYSSVTLLLHMDGSNGSTTITDNSPSPKTYTVFGGAQISTAQSKFGGASLLLDGTGDYLTTSNSTGFHIVNGNAFTVECWAYNKRATGGGVTKYLYRHVHTSGFSAGGWVLAVSGSDDKFFFQWGQGSTEAIPALVGGASSYTQNVWHHVAVSYDGTTYRVFMDGTIIRSSTGLSAGVAGNSSLWIGRDTSSTTRDWDGHIDDLRITKGIARYTAAFTPTTAPFPNQ